MLDWIYDLVPAEVPRQIDTYSIETGGGRCRAG